MVDLDTFEARLDYAIAVHGIDNAEFARRIDQETGQATLRIRPQNGNTVYMETKGPATISSKPWE